MGNHERDIQREERRIEHEWQTVQAEVKRLCALNIPHVLSTRAEELEERGVAVTTGIEIEAPHPIEIGIRADEDDVLATSPVFRSLIPRVSFLVNAAPDFTLSHIYSQRSDRQEFDAYVVTALPSGAIEYSKQRRMRLVDKQRDIAIRTQKGPRLQKVDYENPPDLRQKLLDFFRS